MRNVVSFVVVACTLLMSACSGSSSAPSSPQPVASTPAPGQPVSVPAVVRLAWFSQMPLPKGFSTKISIPYVMDFTDGPGTIRGKFYLNDGTGVTVAFFSDNASATACITAKDCSSALWISQAGATKDVAFHASSAKSYLVIVNSVKEDMLSGDDVTFTADH